MNAHRITRTLGTAAGDLLAVGLGIAAALAATPGIASADSSTDPFSWIGGMDLGDLSVPAQTSASDMQVSIDGIDLFPTAGNTATATSGMGDIAIAIGNGANATATGGIFDSAFADGTSSVADATNGNFDYATAVGDATALGDGLIGHTEAIATDGSFNYASANGTDSVAFAGHGSGDAATVLGHLGSAFAGFGNGDLASIVSTSTGTFGDLAGAGGISPALLGSDDIAVVVGEDSGASAGASLLTAGNSDLAAVFGDMLTASEFGVNNMVDIVP